jgi:sterol desaturase/sphingolipid hydroxylase (fatty acid hydroxylase superfamily)
MNTAPALAWMPVADLAGWQALARVLATQFLAEGLRYGIAALLLWGLLHVALRRRLAHRLIAGWPQAHDVRREIGYSASSLLIFAAIGSVVFAGVTSGHLVIYRKPEQYGWAWLALSLPAMLLWHDAYFYWTHRLLHRPWWLRHVHGVHHRSRNPSPWAAYAFHPVEALINGLVTPLALLAVPLHWSVVLAFGLHQVLRNAHGHAAVETMPQGFVRHALGRHFTTTTHHHLHHETARGNYGLWFTWWDRWCSTERPDYAARFDAATQPLQTPLPTCAGGTAAAERADDVRGLPSPFP